VHGDVFRLGLDPIQAGSNGILPAFAAGDNRPDLAETRVRSDFSDFIKSFFARDDDDFANGSRAVERADCISDY